VISHGIIPLSQFANGRFARAENERKSSCNEPAELSRRTSEIDRRLAEVVLVSAVGRGRLNHQAAQGDHTVSTTWSAQSRIPPAAKFVGDTLIDPQKSGMLVGGSFGDRSAQWACLLGKNEIAALYATTASQGRMFPLRGNSTATVRGRRLPRSLGDD
jgi:hypothetical protein